MIKGKDAVTRSVAATLHYIGSCSKIKLFLVLLASRLPILLFIGCLWDLAVEDYDTSTSLIPSALSGNPYERVPADDQTPNINKGILTAEEEASLGHSQPTTNTNIFFRGESFRSLRALRHWDVIHFNHIAVYGYTHEHLHAFFPGVPYLLRMWGWAASALDDYFMEPVLASLDLGPGLGAVTLRNALRYLLEDFGAVAISVGAFAAAGVVLRSLTYLMLAERGSDIQEVWEGSAVSGGITQTTKEPIHRPTVLGIMLVIYVTMPAGVFTLIPYTESLFALLTFLGIYAFKRACMLSDAVVVSNVERLRRAEAINASDAASQRAIAKAIQRRYAISAFFFMLATSVRSNGFLMVGYFLHELFFHRWRMYATVVAQDKAVPMVGDGQQKTSQASVLSPNAPVLSGGLSLYRRAIITGASIFIAAVPYGLVNYIAWNTFCGVEGQVRVDCPLSWWQFYGYVQRKYWGVYPFSAYTIKNLPNFIIPAPLVFFVAVGLALYWRPRAAPPKRDAGGKLSTFLATRAASILLNPHIMCLLFMILFASALMHIQVMVRFVFASPAYYWLMTSFVLRAPRMFANSYIVWATAWLAAGCIAFTNHYPWT